MAVPSWTYCQKCTPVRWKKRLKPNDLLSNDPYKGVPFKCNKEKALISNMLMYCENTFAVIGYRKPICRLRE